MAVSPCVKGTYLTVFKAVLFASLKFGLDEVYTDLSLAIFLLILCRFLSWSLGIRFNDWAWFIFLQIDKLLLEYGKSLLMNV
jgi:hypothetical protein